MNRGTTRLKLGIQLLDKDPAAAAELLDASLTDFETAGLKMPGMWHAWMYRAEALERLGRFEEALDDIEKAESCRQSNKAVLGSFRARLESAAQENAGGWMLQVRAGIDAGKDGRFAEAAAELEKALPVAPENGGARERHLVAAGRFELARALAALSSGMGLEAVPVDAAALRERSVSELREAMRAGWRDFDRVEQDEIFEPLRGLESFKSLRAEMRRGR